uniref:Uncharacterized protein n=1 Tax=Panagrolaimus sp. PS1159 TaxID=55785 RepID=A0AC35GLH1_9BILA
MLAPIVTKDMKLFQTKPIPTTRIKNVRSRAQSLQDFAKNTSTSQRIKIAPTQKRNAQSVGNLSLPNLSRSPPKLSTSRMPLAAIAEGIEMPSSSGGNGGGNLTNVPASEPNVHSISKNSVKPRTVALDDLRVISSKTFVDPTQSLTNSENASAENSGTVSPSSNPGEKTSPSSNKKSFINKLTSVFKSNKKNSIDDDGSTSPNS